MKTLYHGSANQDWTPHGGACMTPSHTAAYDYAPAMDGRVSRIKLDTSDLNLETVRLADMDLDPIDTDVADDVDALRKMLGVADDVDVVAYDDTYFRSCTPTTCYRLLTTAAVQACTVEATAHADPGDVVDGMEYEPLVLVEVLAYMAEDGMDETEAYRLYW